jgi:hypothetical protein
MPTTKEILIAAKALISNKENWCQNKSIKKKEDGTISYCSIGAIVEIAGVPEAWDERQDAFSELRTHTNGSIADFNDSHTHTEVMELFDKAIASAE